MNEDNNQNLSLDYSLTDYTWLSVYAVLLVIFISYSVEAGISSMNSLVVVIVGLFLVSLFLIEFFKCFVTQSRKTNYEVLLDKSGVVGPSAGLSQFKTNEVKYDDIVDVYLSSRDSNPMSLFIVSANQDLEISTKGCSKLDFINFSNSLLKRIPSHKSLPTDVRMLKGWNVYQKRNRYFKVD